MPNYDVSVSMNMVDNVTRKLRDIQKKMDSVVSSAQAYNTVVEKLTRSFNAMDTSAINSTTSVGKLADQLERVADAQTNINSKMKFPTARTSGGSTVTAPKQTVVSPVDTSDISRFNTLRTNLTEYQKSIAPIVSAHKELNAELKKTPNAPIDTSGIQASLGTTLNTLKHVVALEEEIAQMSMTPENLGSTNLALATIKNRVDSVTFAYDRMTDAMNAGQYGNVKDVRDAFDGLGVAIKNVEGILKQVRSAMQNTDLSTSELDALSAKAVELDTLLNKLRLDHSNLASVTKESIVAASNMDFVDISNIKNSMEMLKVPLDDVLRKQRDIITEFGRMPVSAQNISVVRNSMNGLLDRINETSTAQRELVQVLRQSGDPNVRGAEIALDSLENSMNDAIATTIRLKSELNRFGTPDADAVKNALKEVKDLMESVKTAQGKLTKEIGNFPKAVTEIDAVDRAFIELKGNVQRTVDVQSSLHNQLRKTSSAMSSASVSTDRFNQELRETSTNSATAKSGLDSLVSSVKNLAGAYLGLEGAKAVLNTSDSLILTEGKLSNVTDDVEGLMNDIYQMSQDTRTGYLDNASQMAKMWQLTGGTEGIFDTQDKLLQFNEVLNKGFILGGSGTREINASLYQLTQALSSGRLQGDELRSLAENAPYLINAVTNSLENMYNEGKDQSEWIDLTYKDLKELGAEGVLTSDLIVAAVLNSTDEIRNAYENLTPTFEQTFQTLKNQATKMAEPVLKKLNEIINSEAFEKTAQVIMKILAVVVAALGPVIDIILWVGELMADNWGIVEPIIWGIVGALATYGAYLAIIKGATIAVTIASKAMAAVQLIFKGLTMMAILYRVAVGKATWTQAKMSAAVLFGAQADAIKTKTGLGSALAEWEKTKAMWGSTSAAWANATATGAATGANVAAAGATGAFASAVAWLNTVLLANPITWVVLAIVALIAVIYLAVKAWNHFKDDTLTVLGAIAGGVAWLGGWIANVFIGIWNGALTCLSYIAAGLVALGAVVHNIIMGIVNIFLKAAGVVAGTFMAAWAAIQNGGIWLWNGLVECAEGITNAFIWMKNVLNNVFVTLFGWIVDGINGILGALNKLIDGYNAVAGALGGDKLSRFGTIETEMKIVDTHEGFVDFSGYKGEYKDISAEFNKGLHMFDGYLQEYDSVGDAFDKTLAVSSAVSEGLMADYVDPNEWASAGRNWGDNATGSISDWWDGLMGQTDYTDYMTEAEKQMADAEKALEEAKKAADNATRPNLSGGGLTPEQESQLGGIKGDTGALADEVTLTNKELELLRELAERRAINRFTTAEIKITNNMTNNIDSEMDMDGVVNYLTEELNKALVAGSEAANHY